MAIGNFNACLAVTLPHEGGYVDHPRDPGGATNMGITHRTLAAHRGRSVTKADVRGLTLDEARAIYRAGYWNPIKGESLPAGVDLTTFDYGVNSGPSRSVKDLQRVLGVSVDGRVGPETLAASVRVGGKATVQKHCARRLSFVRGLGTFKTFGRGWSRRIADIEARGVAMALTASPARHGDVAGDLKGEAVKAEEKASTQTKSAGGAATGGVAVGGGDAVISGDPNWMLIAAAVAIVIVVAGVLIVKARQNKDRAEAYTKVAAAQA